MQELAETFFLFAKRGGNWGNSLLSCPHSLHPNNGNAEVRIPQIAVAELTDFLSHLLHVGIEHAVVLAFNYCSELVSIAKGPVADNLFCRTAFACASVTVNDFENAE